jgi:Arc/MetJ-type ribon-helix-helix transcriptional regulator
MDSSAIIEEIRHLPPAGQAEVIRFALRLAQERALTPDELTALARRMAESHDPAEVEKLKDAVTRGFYGDAAHA